MTDQTVALNPAAEPGSAETGVAESRAEHNRLYHVLLVVSLLVALNLSVLLNVPVARPFFGYLFLTLVPGWLLFRVLRINLVSLTARAVLVIGLGIAFMLIYPLVASLIIYAAGVKQSLGTVPMLLSLDVATIVLAGVAAVRNRDAAPPLAGLASGLQGRSYLVLPAFLPLAGLAGVYLMNDRGNNLLLTGVIMVMAVYVIFLGVRRRRVPGSVFPVTLYLFALTLFLMFVLRSPHIIAGDAHLDFYQFQRTLQQLHWQPESDINIQSSLAISTMPTVYHSIMQVDPEALFRLMYLPMLAFLPLIVYVISARYVDSYFAFLAGILFMSGASFLSAPELARMALAVMFFALIILAMFRDDLTSIQKRALFAVFIISIAFTTYASCYIAIIMLGLAWIGRKLLDLFMRWRRGDRQPNRLLSPHLETMMGGMGLALFLVLIFFWYNELTGPSFFNAVSFIKQTLHDLPSIFSGGVRGSVAEAAFGTTLGTATVPQFVEHWFSWAVVLFISAGLLFSTISVLKRLFPGRTRKLEPGDPVGNLDADFLSFGVVAFFILVSSIALPWVSMGYEITRTYFQVGLVLMVFPVFAALTFRWKLKIPAVGVLLAVIVPYFLCTTGVVGLLWHYPRTITLNSTGVNYNSNITFDQEVSSARWLRDLRDPGLQVNEFAMGRRLVGYAGLTEDQNRGFSQSMFLASPADYSGYVVMDYLHMMFLSVSPGSLLQQLDKNNKIYDNGGLEIYRLLR